MHISNYLNVAELEEAVRNKTVRKASHETLPLVLYTYTQQAVFQGNWTDAERKCRGLVVEDTGQIIAWSMQKFFNFNEHANGKTYAPTLPDGDFEIFAKMDGSMGTCFFYDDQWHVASKGSFHSEQAQWATEYLNSKLWLYGDEYEAPESIDMLNHQKTYVCEIIYPENRIVVNYGSLEDLTLLTVYDTATGEEEFTEEHRLEWGWVGSVVPRYNPWSLNVAELQHLADENVLLDEDNGDRTVDGTACEGYVVRFSDGTRCKIKLSDYLRLHKTLTNCTERSIWEMLSTGGSFEKFLENTPDEFHDWVSTTIISLEVEHRRLINEAVEDARYIVEHYGTDRKTFALEAQKQPHPSAVFLAFDGSLDKLESWAWKQVRPEATKPFKSEESA